MRILLIAPPFFGYYQEILAELAHRGIEADYVNDRPSDSVAFRSIGRLSYWFVQSGIDRHFDRVLAQVETNHYDVIFSLGGMSFCFSRGQMERLRARSDARLVAYRWDALRNCQRTAESLDLFDDVFSFEPMDCREHSLRFLPLFYSNAYGEIPDLGDAEGVYDACFVGSVHQASKFKHVRAMIDSLEQQGARVFKYYYMPSRSVANLRRVTNPTYYMGQRFEYGSLSRSQLIDVYSKSRCIIDSPQANQNGLTMRTIETLGARRKLVTTNSSIRYYDFYEYGNVSICAEGQAPDIDFVMAPPAPVPDEVRTRYSLSSWLDQILGTSERS